MDGTVLIADDDRTIRTVLSQALSRAGCRVHATSSLLTLLRWVNEGKGDLVITDVVMPDGNGLEIIPQIAQERSDLPVIVISARNTILTAIQAAEAKAFDYLPKPFDLPELMRKSARALARKAIPGREDAPPAQARTDTLPLVGRSAPMQALYRRIARVMNADIPILIRGESGAGKSLIAKTIHDLSERGPHPFVIVDAAVGADVAALRDRAAQARGGTLLIDEVSDFGPEAQALTVRLLDALPRPAPRVITASRADLRVCLSDGGVRDDLFYRLDGVALSVPALCERVEDIPLLIEHFMALGREEGLRPRRMSDEAVAFARGFRWPGNVRQLAYAVRNLTMTGGDGPVTVAEIGAATGGGAGGAGPGGGGNGDDEMLSATIERHLRRHFGLHGDGELPSPGLYQRILREIERPLIEISLDETGGNQAKCANLLGINRNTLRKKMKELDIRVTRRRKLM